MDMNEGSGKIMAETERQLLINRKQDISVYRMPDGKHLQVEAEMQDEVHDMRIQMTLSYQALKIKEVRFEMPGVPDRLCTEARQLADTLVGQHAVPGLRWGGENKSGNCLLLKDLFRAACTMMSYAQSCVSRVELNALFPGITEEQLFKIWTFMRPDMKNTCLRYAENSAFMQRVQGAFWPEGAKKLLEGL